jgi:CubicO group peptidase (beta-lactamase class C family)
MFNKLFNEWLLLVVLVFSALYLRFNGAFADVVYVFTSIVGIIIFTVRLFSKSKASDGYVNGTYLKVIYFLFILLLGYSLLLNSISRLVIGASFWRVIDIVAVFSVGALALFALSNLSRVVRTLRAKEEDKTKPFYVSMILRIVCFLLMIHLPTYAPSYRTKPIKDLKTRSVSENLPATLSADFDSIIDGFSEDIVLQGVSFYLKKGEQSYEAHAGVINKDLQRRPSATDYYQIASVSKVFTATLFADFLKEGKVDSQTVLSDLYDSSEWPGSMGDVPLISLATHTSGVPRLSPVMQMSSLKSLLRPYHFYGEKAFMEDLVSVDPIRQKNVNNSNFGYAVLGQALTKASGMDYLDGRGLLNNFKVRVATPFGMKNVALANEVVGQNSVYAASTLRNGKAIPRWTNSQIAGAGTFIATLNDLKAFVNAYLNDHLQPDFGKSYTTWWATQYIKLELPDSERTQRLGWVEQPFELENGSTVSMYWHNGSTFGNTSFVAFIPELELSVVALSNTAKSVDALAIEVMKRATR